MAVPYQHVRSSVAGAIPSTLLDGQIAVQMADRTLFLKDSTGSIHDLLNIDCGEVVPPPSSSLSMWAAESLELAWHWSN